MHISGIIAEYDPFHNGHAYHIAKTKSENGCDGVVVALGGEFTQRGEPAWCSKYLRAACAISGGADLVVEIPLPYAVGSAERFAEGGVMVLGALGCVDRLSFGSESGNAEDILKYAQMESSDDFISSVKEEMKDGISAPAARQKAAEKLFGDIAYISNNPNDTLGKEYTKWILKEKYDMNIFPVTRYGAGHGEEYSAKSGIASASYIRSFCDIEDVERFVPGYVFDLLLKEYQSGRVPTDFDKYELLALSLLRTMSVEEIKKVPDAKSEGLYNRVYKAVRSTSSLNSLYDEIKTKRYTMSRVKRVIAGAVLGLDEEKIKWAGIPYIRVLAMNSKGKEILKKASETSKIPIGSALKDLSKISDKALYMAELESKSEDLWQLLRKNPGICGNAYTEKIIIK